MTLPEEPAAWHRLHAMAQGAPDAQSLAQIIDEMNRILDEHQKVGGWEPQSTRDSQMASPVLLLEVGTSQGE